jgi:thiamine-phosphate pyrophosphorylase
VKLLADCHLYTFVDTAYLHGRDPAEVARQLCDGGSDIIQLRAKESSPEEIGRMAERILPITQAAGVPLVINDLPDVARSVGAEFCHLGQEDFFDAGFQSVSQLRVPSTLRSSATAEDGSSALRVGLSTHAPDQCQRAVDAGADYVAIGPVYATGTKPTAIPVTLDYVRWAAANVDRPWFAIGGINLNRLDAVLDAGATRICVVSAILDQEDPAAACRQFKKRMIGGGGL